MAELMQIFKDAKRVYDGLKDFPKMLFEPDPNRDKRSWQFRFDGMKEGYGGFSDMTFRAECHWGEYGRSGCGDSTSPELGKYLAMAINENIRQIYKDAVYFAQQDMLKAQQNAQKEAEEVLEEISN